MLAQVLLLAFQIKRDHDVRLIRYWAAAVVMPFERGGTDAVSHTGGIWSDYIGLRGARAENARLRSELDQLRLRNRELEGQAGEAQRLSALLNFREAHPEAPMLAAQVIGASADPTSHTLFLNRGERDHVRRNHGGHHSRRHRRQNRRGFPSQRRRCLLINDKDSGVGALLADTRTHGVVKGSGDPDAAPGLCGRTTKKSTRAKSFSLPAKIASFPKDLLIGTVVHAPLREILFR